MSFENLTIIVLAAVIFILLILNLVRFAEIRKISRQLRFIRDNRSNMEISYNTPFREINELISGINDVLKKCRKIESLSERRESEFKSTITNLSHDIRTPLTSLDGYFQLLSQAEDEEEKSHYSQIIGARISSLKDILEELFTYTKLQNPDFELKLEPVNITQILFDSVFAFYDDFSRSGIEPAIDIYDGELLIDGSEEALKRVFCNIIRNAREHGGSGTEKCRVSVGLAKEGDKAVFRCSNNVGDNEDMEVERVFERFYKSDKARTVSSTGLGLSIAKELVQRMDGEIGAELSEGEFAVRVEFLLKYSK